MYNKIINPITNRYVNINSKQGKTILNNYINYLNGGGPIMYGGTLTYEAPDGINYTFRGNHMVYSQQEAAALNLLECKLLPHVAQGDLINMKSWWRGENYYTYRGQQVANVDAINGILKEKAEKVPIGNLIDAIKYIELAIKGRDAEDQETINAGKANLHNPHVAYTNDLKYGLKTMKDLLQSIRKCKGKITNPTGDFKSFCGMTRLEMCENDPPRCIHHCGDNTPDQKIPCDTHTEKKRVAEEKKRLKAEAAANAVAVTRATAASITNAAVTKASVTRATVDTGTGKSKKKRNKKKKR